MKTTTFTVPPRCHICSVMSWIEVKVWRQMIILSVIGLNTAPMSDSTLHYLGIPFISHITSDVRLGLIMQAGADPGLNWGGALIGEEGTAPVAPQYLSIIIKSNIFGPLSHGMATAPPPWIRAWSSALLLYNAYLYLYYTIRLNVIKADMEISPKWMRCRKIF